MRPSRTTSIELLAVIVLIAGLTIALLPTLRRADENRRRSSCQNNLKQFGAVFKMYSEESPNYKYPPLAPYAMATGVPAFAAPDPSTLYPQYLTDLDFAHCPSDRGAESGVSYRAGRLPEGLLDEHVKAARMSGDAQSQRYFYASALGRSYWYCGYTMTKIEEFYGIWNALGVRPNSGSIAPGTIVGTAPVTIPLALKDWDADLEIDGKLLWTAIQGTGTGGGKKVRRLCEGVERFAIADHASGPGVATSIHSMLPVMFDTFGRPYAAGVAGSSMPLNHPQGGCNVLYMDGRVEFVAYPSRFPVISDAENGYGLVRQIGFYGLD